MRTKAIIGCLALTVLLTSCGKKTDPIPPQAMIPAAITDLSYRLDESGVNLSWSPPEKSDRGKKLPAGIAGFLVEKAEYSLDDFCKNCPVRYTESRAVNIDDATKDATGKIIYRDESLLPGHIYYFRVKTKVGWRVTSRPSEPVSFEWKSPAGEGKRQ